MNQTSSSCSWLKFSLEKISGVQSIYSPKLKGLPYKRVDKDQMNGIGKFLFNFPEILLTDGQMPGNFLSTSLIIKVSNFRVNQFIYLFNLTSQILISNFTDIMSAKLFLKFFSCP